MNDKTPKTGDQTRDIRPLQRRASFQPGTANAEKRTVDVVWTTGAKVLRNSWDGQFFEDLSLDPSHVRMGRLNNGAPFLPNHDGSDVSRILGVVESARLEGNKGVATVRFAAEGISAEADKVFRLIQDGIAQNVSVGYRVHKFEKVDGSDAKTPTFRAVDWEPYEISAVPMGADDGAGFRSAEATTPNPCVFTDSTRTTVQEEQQMADEKEVTPAPVVDAVEVRKEEVSRITGILSAVRAAKLGDAFADEMIRSDKSLSDVRALVLENLAKRDEETTINGHVRVEITDDNKDKQHRHLTAALIERMGVTRLVDEAVKRGSIEKTELDGGEYRGKSALRMIEMHLEDKGVKTRGMSAERIIREAFKTRGGYATTGDLPIMMEEAINKTLLASYSTSPDVWREFCATKEVPDFRDHSMYRNGTFGTLDTVNEHGEYKNKSIPDGEKFTVNVEKKGNIIGLTEEMLINDDLGSLADLVSRFGRAAGLTIESDVFTQMALNSGAGPTQSDSHPFFYSATRANVGSSSANTAAAWDADRVLLATQRDVSSNEYLGIRPQILVNAIGKEMESRILNQSAVKIGGSNSEPNVAQGMFRKIVSTPRVAGTKRYMFSDPNLFPVIWVVFLQGKGQGPVLESQDGWRVDGIEWKIKLYYKVNFGDYRGAIYNAGA